MSGSLRKLLMIDDADRCSTATCVHKDHFQDRSGSRKVCERIRFTKFGTLSARCHVYIVTWQVIKAAMLSWLLSCSPFRSSSTNFSGCDAPVPAPPTTAPPSDQDNCKCECDR
ncbi:hypothetical protein LSH36_916g00062 [Paralvinella palmiformis]|uniref:Uncharacterized protein n=1 Tax=Paralvinella palmiformis TaxID=53620 RepID=A0AAD9IXZ3_9ANNE|nr:hypothetical protein LSH36_916g00062 [Paralvinella palmiformis]